MTPGSFWDWLIYQVRGLRTPFAGESNSERGGSLGMRVRGPFWLGGRVGEGRKKEDRVYFL
jgi:hypothetical protein